MKVVKSKIVKSQILDQLAKNYPTLLRKDIERCLNSFLNKIISSLKNDKSVQLRGWGTLKTKEQKARFGRNPKTNTEIYIPEKKTIQWKMSKELFNALNNKNKNNE